eukprot:3865388-Rhodomonas_salina.2
MALKPFRTQCLRQMHSQAVRGTSFQPAPRRCGGTERKQVDYLQLGGFGTRSTPAFGPGLRRVITGTTVPGYPVTRYLGTRVPGYGYC